MYITKVLARRKENKQEKYREMLRDKTGIYFTPELETEVQKFPYLKYILNAMIIFGCTYGSIMCLVTSFNMDMDRLTLGIVCAFLSIVFAGLYSVKYVKYVAYMALLFISITVLTSYYFYINSGVSAMVNICLDRINDVFPLPRIREYSEYIDDRYRTITIALCVVALLMVLLLNIMVSEFMNLVPVFLITFPFVQFGAYFGFAPEILPMAMVMGSWGLILIMRMSGAYDGLANKMKVKTDVKRNIHRYGFTTDPNNCALIGTIIGGVILVIFLFLSICIPQKDFAFSTGADRWKEATNQPVKNFLAYGFASLFPADKTKVAMGQISNGKSVSFDGQTDLLVTMANYEAERIYLRGFAGQEYLPYRYEWTNSFVMNNFGYGPDAGVEIGKARMDYFNFPANVLAYDMNADNKFMVLKHKIKVEIVDDNLLQDAHRYVPYYANVDDTYLFYSDSEIGTTYDNYVSEFECYSFHADGVGRNSFRELYDGVEKGEPLYPFREQNNDYYLGTAMGYYLTVPESNMEAIQKFCDEYGIKKTDEDVIPKVVAALRDNYSYTVNPGRVPRSEEYVNYFLNVNKKGYCVHFATAATLIFRHLGIPARYAEGYVVDWIDMVRGQEVETDSTEWLEGVDASGLKVVEASIADANGHAWVEVYYDGLGWVPVEVTNSQAIEEDNGFLRGLFGGGLFGGSPLDNPMNIVSRVNVEKTTQNVKNSGIILVLFGVLAYLVRMAYLVIRRKMLLTKADREKNPGARYDEMVYVWKAYYEENEKEYSFREFADLMEERNFLEKEESEKLLRFVERALYSGKTATQEEYDEMIGLIKKAKKNLIQKLNYLQTVNYYLWKQRW